MADLIDRQAAIELADSLKNDLPDDEQIAYGVIAHNEGILEYSTALSLLPSAQPVRHGKWTEETHLDDGYAMLSRRCSNCYIQLSKITMTGNVIVIECDMRNYRYCPNCGAKMDLEDEQ